MYKSKSKFYQKSGPPEKFSNEIIGKLKNPLWLTEFKGDIPDWIKEFQVQLDLYKKYQKKKSSSVLNRIDFKELINNYMKYIDLLKKYRCKSKTRSKFENLLKEIQALREKI